MQTGFSACKVCSLADYSVLEAEVITDGQIVGEVTMRVVLEVIKSINADVVGKNLVFDECGMYIVGRPAKDGSNRDIPSLIPGDQHLSRGHMMIMISPGQVLLRDISRFGTRVNGQKVTETRLKDGDVLRGGKTKFRVRLESMQEAPGGAGEDGASDTSDDPWKTKYGDSWPPVREREVQCLVCREPARNSPLSDLTETSLIAYVCPTCRAQTARSPMSDPALRKAGHTRDGHAGTRVQGAAEVNGNNLRWLRFSPPRCA